MTLLIQKPTGGKLVLAKGYPNDPDVLAYIAAVQAADESASPGIGALEIGTVKAIDDFVTGCKADGIWSAIKASCILAGARTLAGALVPLVGAAPTNVGGLFVSGDYNRKTGLVGDGSTKYLDSNRAGNADPQNNVHFSVHVTQAPSATNFLSYLGNTAANAVGANIIQVGGTGFGTSNDLIPRARSSASGQVTGQGRTIGLKAVARSDSASCVARSGGSDNVFVVNSDSPNANNILVFATFTSAPVAQTDARLAFYIIGESLNLALLDARVTDLINAFAAAIP